MNTLSDQKLLADYAARRSEAAFTELVRRHVDLVYSAALRMVRDAHLAEDVTQRAFTALAQNAGQLTDRAVLSGWLHRTAQNIAANTVRSEVRRRAREQEAVLMNEILSADSDVSWQQIAPHLDTALGELSEADRDAVLLRYFEKKSAQEMAEALGLSPEAAQKRVTRAVEKLRDIFSKRKITIGTTALVVLVSANAVQSAPVALAATISAVALSGAAVSTSAIIAATKTIAMTTLQKMIVTATVAVLAGAGIYEARQAMQLREQVNVLEQKQAPLEEQVQRLQSDVATASNRLMTLNDELARSTTNNAELLKLRGEVSALRRVASAQKSKGAAPVANGLINLAAEEMRTQATNAILQKVHKLQEEIALTPEQAEAYQNIRLKFAEAHTRKTLGDFTGNLSAEENESLRQAFAAEREELAGILTPEQQAARKENAANQQNKNALFWAKSAVAELTPMLNLTQAQQEELTPVLAQLGPINALAADASVQFEARLNALKTVLTPQQLEVYRQQKEKMLGQASNARQALLGK